jgi:hypothetical protein
MKITTLMWDIIFGSRQALLHITKFPIIVLRNHGHILN